MQPPPYVDLGVRTSPTSVLSLTDVAEGRRQRDPLDAGAGMNARDSTVEGSGLHGATALRQSYAPWVLPVDVEVFATTGTTVEAREASYRENLRKLQTMCAGQVPLVGAYGDGTTVATTAIARAPFPRGDDILDGNVHTIPFLVIDFIREETPTTMTWDGGLADPATLSLDDFVCSAPLIDLVLEITGASGELVFRPLHPLGLVPDWTLRYSKSLAGGEILTIDTAPLADPVLTSSVPANVDYRKLSHPGNSSYLLEVPPGWGTGSDVPRIEVEGGPEEVTITGTRAWLAF